MSLPTMALLLLMGCDALNKGDKGDDDAPAKATSGKAAKADKAGDDKAGAADDGKAKPPEKFGGKELAMGDKADMAGMSLVVEEVKPCKYEREKLQKSLDKRGEKYVGAKVLFEATGEQKVRTSRDFRARDADNIAFRNTSVGGTDCGPMLKNTWLETGEKARGWVIFKVPSDVKGLTMRYKHHPPRKKGEKHKPAPQQPVFKIDG